MSKLTRDESLQRKRKAEPLQLTALLYLKEALLKENYEICHDLITLAKELGTSETQIAYLLEDPRRSPT